MYVPLLNLMYFSLLVYHLLEIKRCNVNLRQEVTCGCHVMPLYILVSGERSTEQIAGVKFHLQQKKSEHNIIIILNNCDIYHIKGRCKENIIIMFSFIEHNLNMFENFNSIVQC